MFKYVILSIIISTIIYLNNLFITFIYSKYNFERMKNEFLHSFILLFIPFINVITNIGGFIYYAIDSIKNRNLTYDEAKKRHNKKIEKAKIEYEKHQEETKKKREKNNEMKQLPEYQLTSCSGTYLGGQEDLAETGHGKISLTNEYLEFKISEFPKKGEFKMPLRQINSMAYDTEKNLTLARTLVFGVFALGMKKNSYYLVIDYKNDYDISNQVIFDLGYSKNQEFYNKLNVQRNKCIKKYIDSKGVKAVK